MYPQVPLSFPSHFSSRKEFEGVSPALLQTAKESRGKVPNQDDQLIADPYYQQHCVQRFFNAMVNTEAYNDADNNLNGKNIAKRLDSGYYSAEYIQTVCWNLCIKTADWHQGYKPIPNELFDYREETFETIEKRVSRLVECLRDSKLHCGSLLEVDFAYRLVNTPDGETERKEGNKKGNKKKGVHNALGRGVLEEKDISVGELLNGNSDMKLRDVLDGDSDIKLSDLIKKKTKTPKGKGSSPTGVVKKTASKRKPVASSKMENASNATGYGGLDPKLDYSTPVNRLNLPFCSAGDINPPSNLQLGGMGALAPQYPVGAMSYNVCQPWGPMGNPSSIQGDSGGQNLGILARPYPPYPASLIPDIPRQTYHLPTQLPPASMPQPGPSFGGHNVSRFSSQMSVGYGSHFSSSSRGSMACHDGFTTIPFVMDEQSATLGSASTPNNGRECSVTAKRDEVRNRDVHQHQYLSHGGPVQNPGTGYIGTSISRGDNQEHPAFNSGIEFQLPKYTGPIEIADDGHVTPQPRTHGNQVQMDLVSGSINQESHTYQEYRQIVCILLNIGKERDTEFKLDDLRVYAFAYNVETNQQKWICDQVRGGYIQGPFVFSDRGTYVGLLSQFYNSDLYYLAMIRGDLGRTVTNFHVNPRELHYRKLLQALGLDSDNLNGFGRARPLKQKKKTMSQ